jgi:hypothetical protein
MVISFLLSAMMMAAIGCGLVLRRRAPLVGAAIAFAALGGLYFVWMPTHLSAVANVMGVGRGTDLLLYFWVSLTMLAMAGLVFELRHLQRQLTLVAREQALQHARSELSVPPFPARPFDESGAAGSPQTTP